jgi:hypothetical protein
MRRETPMGEDTDSRAARAGRNQALYREVNERVREMNEAFDAFLPLGEWICECANEQCFETIEMTHEEYEAVRAGGTRFFVKPDHAHVIPEAEVVVERHERYWVVDKVGVAGAVAERQDPRSVAG